MGRPVRDDRWDRRSPFVVCHAAVRQGRMTDHAMRWSVPPCSFGLRMGEEADVEILGGVDQLLDRTAVALRVAEEELGDALLAGKLEERIGEIAAPQTVHLGVHFARQRQVAIETGMIDRKSTRLNSSHL